MTHADLHCCAEMRKHLNEGEVGLRYSAKFREYSIRVLDGGSSVQEISHCPWCGSLLPLSLRDAWFQELDRLCLDPGDPRIPDSYRSHTWWSGLEASRYPCRCCGQSTLYEAPPGSFQECAVCGWIDDDIQAADPTQASGQNSVTLRTARSNFSKFGAITRRGAARRTQSTPDRRRQL